VKEGTDWIKMVDVSPCSDEKLETGGEVMF
jgi:hypothetical protein